MNDKNIGHEGEPADRREIPDRVVRELVHARCDGVGRRVQQQRVTVRSAPHDRLGADNPARPRFVVDNDGLVPRFVQLLT